MTIMTPKAAKMAYLAWLRTEAPAVYVSAVRKATGRVRSLGGLNDDLVQSALSPGYRHSFLGDDGDSITLDPIDVSAISTDQPITTDFSFDTTPSTAVSVDAGAIPTVSNPYGTPVSSITPAGTTAATSTGSSSTFANILTAVAAVGAASVGVMNASNQSSLIALNTQRAAQGLPPVNAAGQVVSATGTASPALLAFENAITGGAGGSLLPLLLIGGALFLLFSGKKSATPAT